MKYRPPLDSLAGVRSYFCGQDLRITIPRGPFAEIIDRSELKTEPVAAFKGMERRHGGRHQHAATFITSSSTMTP
jgi:hypothetical protein